jgi:hypothetical protein
MNAISNIAASFSPFGGQGAWAVSVKASYTAPRSCCETKDIAYLFTERLAGKRFQNIACLSHWNNVLYGVFVLLSIVKGILKKIFRVLIFQFRVLKKIFRVLFSQFRVLKKIFRVLISKIRVLKKIFGVLFSKIRVLKKKFRSLYSQSIIHT